MTDKGELCSEVFGAYNDFFDWLHANPEATQEQKEHELWERFEYVHPIAKNTEGSTMPPDQQWPEEGECEPFDPSGPSNHHSHAHRRTMFAR